MKIYEKDWRYSALRPIVDAFTKASYSNFEVVGEENLPDNGAVILAPNHCNALMDALVVLRTRKQPTVFGARADIFRKKSNAVMLGFLRILPLVRRRDGLRTVAKNNSTIDLIVETLDHDVPFCLFPEGTHRTQHSLLPIGKMPLRLALAAIDQIDPGKPVYIQPVSLEYGDYFRFRSTCLVTFPKPINVRAELKKFSADSHTEAEIYRHFSDLISDGLKQHLTYIEDDEYYEGRWALLKAYRAGSGGRLEERLQRNQACLERMMNREKEHPEKMHELYRKATAFEAERRRKHISIHSFGKDLSKKLITKSIASVFLLPLFALAFLLDAPALLVAHLMKKTFKDNAFKNTACMVTNLFLTPLLTILWAILASKLIADCWLNLLRLRRSFRSVLPILSLSHV